QHARNPELAVSANRQGLAGGVQAGARGAAGGGEGEDGEAGGAGESGKEVAAFLPPSSEEGNHGACGGSSIAMPAAGLLKPRERGFNANASVFPKLMPCWSVGAAWLCPPASAMSLRQPWAACCSWMNS